MKPIGSTEAIGIYSKVAGRPISSDRLRKLARSGKLKATRMLRDWSFDANDIERLAKSERES